MACTCKTCYAWEPKQWEGYRWVDPAARCKVKARFTTPGETCESAALIAPRTVVASIEKQRLTDAPEYAFSPTVNDVPVVEPQLEMYEHQTEAIEYFKDKSEVALFMEMGCGKTATALKIVEHQYRSGRINALLVVAPNDVHAQWSNTEIPKWLNVPYELQCVYGRGGMKKTYMFNDDDKLQIICVNIDTFSTKDKWREITDWAVYKDTCVIIDEATLIKNISALRTMRLLYSMNDVKKRGKTIISSVPLTETRMILTGTPVTNGPMDMWAMMEFIRPNFFNRNYYSFKNHFLMSTALDINGRKIDVPLSADMWRLIKNCTEYSMARQLTSCTEDTFNVVHSQDEYIGPFKHADELREMIVPVSRFKLLRECVDLPEENRSVRELSMSAEQQKCYDDMVEQYISEYDNVQMAALSKLTVMIRLQQISSGFIVQNVPSDDEEDIEPGFVQWIGTSNPKLEALYRDVDESAKPLIIITKYSAEANRIYSTLMGKYKTCLMTGWKRIGTIEEFQAGKYEVMVANSAVVARGFNLQNSYNMLFYSNTFSLEARLQTEGRILRMGQKNACNYVDYVYKDTVDAKIVAALLMKRNLLDYIRETDNVKELVL